RGLAAAQWSRDLRGHLPGPCRVFRSRVGARALGARPVVAVRPRPRRTAAGRSGRARRRARLRAQRRQRVARGQASPARAVGAAADVAPGAGRRQYRARSRDLARRRRARRTAGDRWFADRRCPGGCRGPRGRPDRVGRAVRATGGVIRMARLPVLALVGRPNVGKSTLFNRLTRSRSALVADVPGLTRDRQYGRGRLGEAPFIVIDSGGFEPVARDGIAAEMARQTRQAVVEADVVVFVVDGREGLSPRDQEIAAELRRTAQRVLLAVNKTEGMPQEQVAAEFHTLGLGDPLAISAAHGDGVRDLVEAALAPLAPKVDDDGAAAPSGEVADAGPRRVKVAVVGRPNAGKSTLINTLLGEERLIAFDQPGTTRDAVAIDFERAGRLYTLIDTAGLRRRGKVTDTVEKFSVVKTLQAIEDCHVCVLLLDAGEQVSDQDATIAGYILEAGRALVVAVNKWDLADAAARQRIKGELD